MSQKQPKSQTGLSNRSDSQKDIKIPQDACRVKGTVCSVPVRDWTEDADGAEVPSSQSNESHEYLLLLVKGCALRFLRLIWQLRMSSLLPQQAYDSPLPFV